LRRRLESAPARPARTRIVADGFRARRIPRPDGVTQKRLEDGVPAHAQCAYFSSLRRIVFLPAETRRAARRSGWTNRLAAALHFARAHAARRAFLHACSVNERANCSQRRVHRGGTIVATFTHPAMGMSCRGFHEW